MNAYSKTIGKRRSPLFVSILSFATFSVYYIYWYYKVTEEMALHCEAVDANPLVSALSVSAGALLIIPPYIEARRMTERLRAVQREEAFAESHPSMGVLLQIFCWVAFPYYIQSELNAHWDLHRKMAERETPG